MDIKHMQIFLQICEGHSFSKAAQRLFMTQQGLSAIVQKLEKELGVPLFERTSSGVTLTAYGSFIRNQWKRIVDIQDATQSMLNSMKDSGKLVLRIAVIYGALSALPPLYLEKFKQAHPEIQIEIIECFDDECDEALLQERADIGLCTAPINENIFLAHTIVKDYMCILAHISNPLAQLQNLKLCEIGDVNLLLPAHRYKIRNLFDEKCEEAAVKLNVRTETLDFGLAHNFIRMAKGACVCVRFLANGIVDTKPIPINELGLLWQLNACIKKDMPPNIATSAFWDYVLEHPCWLPFEKAGAVFCSRP